MKLSTLARLRALRNFDLQLLRIHQVVAGNAKSSRGYLLYCAVARVAAVIYEVAYRVLAAFSGVALAADAVHGNSQSFVRFFADRTIRHRARLEALDDIR